MSPQERNRYHPKIATHHPPLSLTSIPIITCLTFQDNYDVHSISTLDLMFSIQVMFDDVKLRYGNDLIHEP